MKKKKTQWTKCEFERAVGAGEEAGQCVHRMHKHRSTAESP